MQPHFLHNALNTIAALVHDDPDAADAALLHLSQLLRAATGASRRPLHPLADELALARSYAALMQQRFGAQRVRLEWDTDAAPDIDVPALSLQPLLENAFVHAVEPRSGPTTLRISARRLGDHLLLRLANLRDRLQALYGPAATLQLRARPGGGSEAALQIPLQPPSAVLHPEPLSLGAARQTHA
jgi:two-component system LytT family sensor kinase